MKKNKQVFLIAAFLINCICCFAQEVDLSKGNLSVLKGETTINIEFTFETLSVGDFNKEADFIKKKTEEYNAKEPGTGDSWAVKWEADKQNRFPEKFNLGITKYSSFIISADAKYTMIFNTKAIEPGYSVGVSKRNAGIDGTATIVETANRKKIVAVLYAERPPENMWRGAAFDAASRIGDAYFLTGQKIAKLIVKLIVKNNK